MRKIPGSKMMYFYKDSVSPSEIGEDGRLENKTNKITMSGGNWENQEIRVIIYYTKQINELSTLIIIELL